MTCSFLIWLLLVLGCMWIFLLAFNGASSCHPVMDICCIKSAYLSRDYLTLQDKQLTLYFLTNVHRKMMYFLWILLFPLALEGSSQMLDFSQAISHHLFQPQVTSNSYNAWCIGRLCPMGLYLLSHWQAETFHEDLNESLGDSANIYLCKCCYSNVCLCIICHSLQVSPKRQQSFWWWIHLHINAFQVISLHENCHEKVFPCSGMRKVKHMCDT